MNQEKGASGAAMIRKKRDWRFELMRMLAMLGIVIAHYFASDNWAAHANEATWPSAMHQSMDIFGQIGVTWFALISAFFLAHRSSRVFLRAMKVWVETFIYSAGGFLVVSIIVMMGVAYNGPDLSAIRTITSSFLPLISDLYWFVGAYIIMIILSPFLNILVDHTDFRGLLKLITILLFIVFIWKLLNPSIGYFADYGYLCTVYLIGAGIRKYSMRLPHVSFVACLSVFVACWFLCVMGTYAIRSSYTLTQVFGFPPNLLGAGGGASPILSVIPGVCSFLWVVQKRTSDTHDNSLAVKMVRALAPATFGIYLLHTNPLLKPVLFGFIFSVPEPAGLMRKALLAILSIMFIYVTSLLISSIIHYAVICPSTKMLDCLNQRLEVVRRKRISAN